MAIDIERLKRDYRAACNKSCINPDDGPATSFEVARARAALAESRHPRYVYTDWRELRDISLYWMSVLTYMSPGGWLWAEAKLWARVVAATRRRCPATADEVVDAYDDAALTDAITELLREVLREKREEREEREALPLRDLHRRQAAKGYAVNPLRFRQPMS